MSGGRYNYAFDHVDHFCTIVDIEKEDTDYSGQNALRKKFVEHLKIVTQAMRAIEWNDSGDGCDREEELLKKCLKMKGKNDRSSKAKSRSSRNSST